jgi:hypothetical protein
MDHQDVMLSEINPSQKGKYHMIPLTESTSNSQNPKESQQIDVMEVETSGYHRLGE